jgi:hypothetical protein
VSWPLPAGQTISQLWNGTPTISGSNVTVKNVTWNGAIAAGASTSFGLIATGSSSPTPALACASP